MTVERIFPSGAWLVSDVIGGYYVHRVYMGYSKREAVQRFAQECMEDGE